MIRYADQTTRRCTAGAVARRPSVYQSPLPLRAWAARGHLSPTQGSAGEWRQFQRSDVAFVAALNFFEKRGFRLGHAAEIMEEATRQRALWRKGVNAAFLGATGMLLLAKQYNYNGVLGMRGSS